MNKITCIRVLSLLLVASMMLGLAGCFEDAALPSGSGTIPSVSSSGSSGTTEPNQSIPASSGSQTTVPSDSQTTEPAGSTAPSATVPASTPATQPGTVPATVPATQPGTVPTTVPATQPGTLPTTLPATQTTTAPVTTVRPTPPVEPSGAVKRQGLESLAQWSNGAALKAAYDAIVVGIEACQGEISLGNITMSELELVYNCYRNDYPEHFWVANGYSMSVQEDNGLVQALIPEYLMTGTELQQAKTVWNNRVEALLALVKPGMNDYEKELVLHDALLRGCEYKDGKFGHSAYGALVQGQAVCEGYARGFQYLMNRAGINCMIAVGASRRENHAWNMVKIGGKWYYVDATWDDGKGTEGIGSVYYAYFNIDQEILEQEHTLGVQWTPDMAPAERINYIPLPGATAVDLNYHVVNGTVASKFDFDQMVQWMKESYEFRVYVTGDMEQFIQGFTARIVDLVVASGKTDCSKFSYSVNGQEIVIVLVKK